MFFKGRKLKTLTEKAELMRTEARVSKDKTSDLIQEFIDDFKEKNKRKGTVNVRHTRST